MESPGNIPRSYAQVQIGVISSRLLEAWEINICKNPLNRDDGMHALAA